MSCMRCGKDEYGQFVSTDIHGRFRYCLSCHEVMEEAKKLKITKTGNCFDCNIHAAYKELVQRIADIGGKDLLSKCRVQEVQEDKEQPS